MKRFLSILSFLIFIALSSQAQTTPKTLPQNNRPKLVVGIVIDQMRCWNPHRFANKY